MAEQRVRRGVVLRGRQLALWMSTVAACSALAQTPTPPEAPLAEASGAPAPTNAFADGVKAFDSGNYAEAFRLWMPLATKGSAQAQFNIAFMYEKGFGVVKSDAQALEWYVAAAERGDIAAQLRAGVLYAGGVGTAKNLDKAAYWFTQAAKGGAKDPQAAQQAREKLAEIPGRSHVEPEEVTPFDGGRFVLSHAGTGECVVALQGTVTQSTSNRFDDVLEKAKKQGCAPPITLLLESPGGLVDAGIEIGRSVHAEGMKTVARYACASSCANIFLGGVERVLWGSRAEIGLHQPSSVRSDEKFEDRHCQATTFDTAVVAMRRYMKFVLPQTSDEIMKVVMSTPCKSITWVKGSRAVELGVATRIEAEHEDVFGPRSARAAAASAPR